MIPTACTNYPAARERHGDRAERCASYLFQADPPADGAVRALAGLPRSEAHALLDRALDLGRDAVPEAPPELREFLRGLETPPLWVDWSQVDLGGYTFLRCRLGFVVLACLSLPLFYSLPAGNKPLALSGRLVHRAAPRLKETVRFVLATCRKGGLRREGEGWKLTARVRLMHAQVRRLLLESGRWETERWGAPINQFHLAATNLLFSQAVLVGLRRLGYRFVAEETEALMHLWRYSGTLMGIGPELLCATEGEGRRLLELIFAIEGPPDEDSRALVGGVMEAALAYVRHGSVEVAYGISRALIGRERAAALGYPESAWHLLVPTFRPFATGIELCRQWNVPGVRALASVCGTQMLRHLMSDRGLPGPMGEFALPDQLTGTTAGMTREAGR